MPHRTLNVPERGMLDAYEALLASRGFTADAAQKAAAERLIDEVAATGVDQIAVGWLTHSAKVLDIGLDA